MTRCFASAPLLARSSLRAGVLAAALLSAAMPSANAATPGAATSDWPCVQQKVTTLTSPQIWDGPPVEEVKGWFDHEPIRKLLPYITSRRIGMEDAAKAIKNFAEKIPEAERDKMLTVLFAGVLANLNDERRLVMNGIERFQQRQKGRAAELERQGLEISKLKEKAATDPNAAEALNKAEEQFNWDVRVFQERNQNMPLACEIPVLIEQRAFELGREIRSNMKS
jgi:hypothetical protein